jgi:hypothetical protein
VAGARLNSYVIAGGSVVARKAGDLLVWRHVNPVPGDEIETDAQGAAYDPLGNYAPLPERPPRGRPRPKPVGASDR